MLKIAAPFREKKEVNLLIEAGADELYCGYMPKEWEREYTCLEFERKGGLSNFTDLKELRSAVDLAHKKNTPVYLALNGLYVNAQYPLLLKAIEQVETIDFDAFIVADIGLLLTLRQSKTKKKIHISTGGTAFNLSAVNFYRRLGASRIVLDRQITLKSIKALSEYVPEMEFEVFILNTLCVYIDGFCTFLHSYGIDSRECFKHKSWKKGKRIEILSRYDPETTKDACCFKYSIQLRDTHLKKINNSSIKPVFFKHLVDGQECGVCGLYYLSRTKVSSVKIVGRQYNLETRLRSVRLVNSCKDILRNDTLISAQEYIKIAQQLYRVNFEYKGKCKGNNCYHPEII